MSPSRSSSASRRTSPSTSSIFTDSDFICRYRLPRLPPGAAPARLHATSARGAKSWKVIPTPASFPPRRYPSFRQSRVIELEGMIPVANPDDEAVMDGFAEGVGIILMSSDAGLFSFELKSAGEEG
ncbi:hypothetical protein PR202_gb13123 [Eleusine coracana subsp. coracana]|uniref:Uncharacterized protein n=1 Tax=Eleusine coracana subsp. coracana TaxID=191504 RepID=A0AAV5ERS3_ELECO|nr:hypothetical protein PR202_gb13123 [Eleusine coracana subsp. coracana]